MKKILLTLLAIVIVITVAGFAYFEDDYHADALAKQAIKGDKQVKVTKIKEGYKFDGPSKRNAIIFYPGAKVETIAYAPLLKQIAKKDADVFLVDMPLHMAVLGINKADSIAKAYHYAHYYMAGHSLGAAMASQYVAKHLDAYQGLILLAGYPTNDLHHQGFHLLNIYGTHDMDVKSLQKNRQYRPKDYKEVVIKGGNHAQFGNYGVQKKDHQATISRGSQQKQTVQAISKMIHG